MPSSMTLSNRLSRKTGLVNSGKCSLENSTTDSSISTCTTLFSALCLSTSSAMPQSPPPMISTFFALAVGEDRHMGHHLVIDELVARGDLRGAVQHQHLAEVLLLEQHEVLVRGLLLVQHLVDREGHAEAEVVEQGLGKPAFVGHGRLISRSSCPRTRASGNRRGFNRSPTSEWKNGLRILRSPACAGDDSSAGREPYAPCPRRCSPTTMRFGLNASRSTGMQASGLGVAAHEHVERRVVRLRPGVDRDVALGQHRDAGNPAVRLEVMQMDVQQRRARGGDASCAAPHRSGRYPRGPRPRRDRRSGARPRSARRCGRRSDPCDHR